jgi:hypothetical protein
MIDTNAGAFCFGATRLGLATPLFADFTSNSSYLSAFQNGVLLLL